MGGENEGEWGDEWNEYHKGIVGFSKRSIISV